jgi:hypothetical protein
MMLGISIVNPVRLSTPGHRMAAYGTSRPVNFALRQSAKGWRADIAQPCSSPLDASTQAASQCVGHNGLRMPNLFAITDNGSGRAVCEAPSCWA